MNNLKQIKQIINEYHNFEKEIEKQDKTKSLFVKVYVKKNEDSSSSIIIQINKGPNEYNCFSETLIPCDIQQHISVNMERIKSHLMSPIIGFIQDNLEQYAFGKKDKDEISKEIIFCYQNSRTENTSTNNNIIIDGKFIVDIKEDKKYNEYNVFVTHFKYPKNEKVYGEKLEEEKFYSQHYFVLKCKPHKDGTKQFDLYSDDNKKNFSKFYYSISDYIHDYALTESIELCHNQILRFS